MNIFIADTEADMASTLPGLLIAEFVLRSNLFPLLTIKLNPESNNPRGNDPIKLRLANGQEYAGQHAVDHLCLHLPLLDAPVR
jgi:hypothetical protein